MCCYRYKYYIKKKTGWNKLSYRNLSIISFSQERQNVEISIYLQPESPRKKIMHDNILRRLKEAVVAERPPKKHLGNV